MEVISVIIPIYKVEDYLERCIQSIVKQTYSNLEIILVDDGSPDSCGLICDTWAQKDERIKVIHKKNGGLSDARNAGIKKATGEFIAFVDSDDWLAEDFFEILITSLKKSKAQIAASDIVWSYDDHEEYRSRRFDKCVFNTEDALETLLNGEGFYAVAWNKLYKKSYFETLKYPVGRIHEDEFVTYKAMSMADTLVLCQDAKYYYRQRQGSIMSDVSIRHLDFWDAYYERLLFLQANYPRLYKKEKSAFCIMCVMWYRNCLKLKSDDSVKMQQSILKFRKKVHYTFTELKDYSIKELIYILCTAINLPLFCKILNRR